MDLLEEITKYQNVLNESWNEKMATKKKDEGKWKNYTLSELKAELAKCKKNPNKTEVLKKKEHQLTFAIRAKQKNKWGSIKESVPTGSMPLGNGGERIITSHSGDKFRVPSEKEVIEYRNAVKNKDWDKVQNFEENWELIDESKVTPGPFSKKGKLKIDECNRR
jgi:hypothetical protein